MSRRGVILFAAMSVLWGIPYLLIKVAVRELDPVVLVTARTAIGALVMLPVAVSRGALRPALARWRVLIVFTVVEVTLPWLLLADGERRISSSLAGLLVAVVPLAGVLLAKATGDREPVGRTRVLGLLLGLGGVAALLGLDIGAGEANALGALEVIATAVCYAAGALLIGRKLADVPSTGVIAVALASSTVLYLWPALRSLPPEPPSARVLASVAVLGLLCTALAFIVFFALIAEVGPARATVITYVNPAVAVALGITVLSEPVTAGTLVGFPLVLFGSWLATRPSQTPVAVETVPVVVADPGG
jgi:drug/metabolite transporter (DMT)-like permease